MVAELDQLVAFLELKLIHAVQGGLKMLRRIFPLTLLFGAVSSCSGSDDEEIAKVKRLILLESVYGPKSPTDEYYPHARLNGNFTNVYGVWVEDGLYYRALGIPIGLRPAGSDVKDRMPGIPAAAFGKCGRCQRSWKWVEGHSTPYSPESGTFPLCKKCWGELSPIDRLPFYRHLWEGNRAQLAALPYPNLDRDLAQMDRDWPLIEKAVLAGL